MFVGDQDTQVAPSVFSCSVARVGGQVTAEVFGEIDTCSAGQFRNRLLTIAKEHPSSIVVDMANASLLDNASLAVLVEVWQFTRGARDRVRDQVARPLDLSRVRRHAVGTSRHPALSASSRCAERRSDAAISRIGNFFGLVDDSVVIPPPSPGASPPMLHRRAIFVVAVALQRGAHPRVPVGAHVSVQPGSAAKGSFSIFSFSVPNEEPDANTVKLEVTFPVKNPGVRRLVAGRAARRRAADG